MSPQCTSRQFKSRIKILV